MRKLLVVVLMSLMATAVPVLAEFCQQCSPGGYTKDIGTCTECDGPTRSGQLALCHQCSKKLGQCEHCRRSTSASPPATRPTTLAARVDITQPGSYRSGPWEYRLLVTSPGSRSEGTMGKLFFDGKEVPTPVMPGDYYRTPWGDIQWIGDAQTLWGDHGWAPRTPEIQGGRLLPEPSDSPAPATQPLLKP